MNVLISKESSYIPYKKKRVSILFVVLTTACLLLAGVIFSIILNEDNKGFVPLVLLGVSTIYIWIVLFVMTGPYKVIRTYEKFLKDLAIGNSDKELLTITNICDGVSTPNGLSASLVKATIEDNGKSFVREVYVLFSNSDLKEGDHILATLFNNVIIQYERE